MAAIFSEDLKKQTCAILQGAFYEVYGHSRPITISPNINWIEESNRHVFNLYFNTGPVLKKLIKNGITQLDILGSKAEIKQSMTFARQIFTTKEYSNSTYNIKIEVKPWGEVQVEISYLASNPQEIEKVKKAIKPVIAEFKKREAQYNADNAQLEGDVVALVIAAKLKAVVSPNQNDVTLNLGLARTTPESFITKIIAGLPEDAPESAKQNLQRQIMNSFKNINIKLAIPRRVHITLDWPAALTLAAGKTRFHDIEPVNPPKTQASRG